jgi:hypothetical protein
MVGGQESERKGMEGQGRKERGGGREREIRVRVEGLLAELVDLGEYVCVLILLCPHTTIYLSSYYYIFALQ